MHIKIAETHTTGVNVPDRKRGLGMTAATMIAGTNTARPTIIRGARPSKGGAQTAK